MTVNNYRQITSIKLHIVLTTINHMAIINIIININMHTIEVIIAIVITHMMITINIITTTIIITTNIIIITTTATTTAIVMYYSIMINY